MPGRGLLIDGAVQQAAQPGRQVGALFGPTFESMWRIVVPVKHAGAKLPLVLRRSGICATARPGCRFPTPT
jgi:hypothetical protein